MPQPNTCQCLHSHQFVITWTYCRSHCHHYCASRMSSTYKVCWHTSSSLRHTQLEQSKFPYLPLKKKPNVTAKSAGCWNQNFSRPITHHGAYQIDWNGTVDTLLQYSCLVCHLKRDILLPQSIEEVSNFCCNLPVQSSLLTPRDKDQDQDWST